MFKKLFSAYLCCTMLTTALNLPAAAQEIESDPQIESEDVNTEPDETEEFSEAFDYMDGSNSDSNLVSESTDADHDDSDLQGEDNPDSEIMLSDNETSLQPYEPEKFYRNGHAYAVYNDSGSWKEAYEKCIERGGYLAVINDQEENDFLYNQLRGMGIRTAYFGLSRDNDTNTWMWSDGSVLDYSNWAPGEPNSENPNEKYGMFYFKFQYTWNDGDFGDRTVSGGRNYICEWDTTDDFSDERVLNLPFKYSGNEITYPVKWDLQYLTASPDVFWDDHINSMALASLALSQACYYSENFQKKLLIKLGLYRPESDWESSYSKTILSVGNLENISPLTIAITKDVTVGNTKRNIITILSKGSGPMFVDWDLGPDWKLNISYDGFRKATDEAYGILTEKMDEAGIDITDSSNLYLLSGHSLGGAIENLMVEKLKQTPNGGVFENNIKCFTFASPISGYKKQFSGTNCIRNIINPLDLVTQVTPKVDKYVTGKAGRPGIDAFLGTSSRKALSQTYEGLYGKALPEVWVRTSRSKVKKKTTGLGILGEHDLTMYLALLLNESRTIDAKFNNYRIIGAFCPVTVELINRENKVTAKADDQEISTEIEELDGDIWGDAKILKIPADEDVSVRLTAAGDGSMVFSIEDYSDEGQSVSEFDNIQLSKGKSMIMDLKEGEPYHLYVIDENGNRIAEINENGEEEIRQYSLSVTSNTGDSVAGEGSYFYGSEALLEAKPESGYNFIGWYQDDQLLSQDASYKLNVTADKTIEGRFEKQIQNDPGTSADQNVSGPSDTASTVKTDDKSSKNTPSRTGSAENLNKTSELKENEKAGKVSAARTGAETGLSSAVVWLLTGTAAFVLAILLKLKKKKN